MLLWIRSRTIEGCPTCLSFVRVNTKHDWSDTFCALEHHRPRYSLSFVDPRVARHQQHQQKHTLHTWHISAIIPHPSPQPTSRRCGPTCPSGIVQLLSSTRQEASRFCDWRRTPSSIDVGHERPFSTVDLVPGHNSCVRMGHGCNGVG